MEANARMSRSQMASFIEEKNDTIGCVFFADTVFCEVVFKIQLVFMTWDRVKIIHPAAIINRDLRLAVDNMSLSWHDHFAMRLFLLRMI